MLTETKFIDVDAIAIKFTLTIASAKSVEAVDPVDVDAKASKFKLTIASAKSVEAVDPVDVDAIASKFTPAIASANSVGVVDPVDVDAITSKFTLAIASAKSVEAVDPVDVMSTVLTVPAVTSTVVITSAFATPMVSASAKTLIGSKCFTLASTGSRRTLVASNLQRENLFV
jgi:hypothetical protein